MSQPQKHSDKAVAHSLPDGLHEIKSLKKPKLFFIYLLCNPFRFFFLIVFQPLNIFFRPAIHVMIPSMNIFKSLFTAYAESTSWNLNSAGITDHITAGITTKDHPIVYTAKRTFLFVLSCHSL